jgi:hypothetical protein
MDRQKLESLTREELVALAGELGIVRPRSLTIPELMDEIVSRTASSERDKARSRGWFGRARNLLASVIERGLHLPDVVKALRNAPSSRPWPVAPPPLATMTLAEIYAGQGHIDKALHVLDEIITREPEHADARALRQRLDPQTSIKKKPETTAKREEPLISNESLPAVDVSKAVHVDDAAQPLADATPAVVETNHVEAASFEPVSATPEVAAEPVVAESATVAVAVVDAPIETASQPVVEVVAPQIAAAADEPDEAVEASDDEDPVQAESFEDEPSTAAFDSSDRPDIEELPLPERYNVDEIVGIAVDPTTVYVYWEVRPIVLARAHARLSEGTMVVRLVSVTPSWDGPVVEQRDLHIDALYGDLYVRGLRPGSNVRIGVGWLVHGTFAPFAIGEPVTTPRKDPAFATASKFARWTPQGAPETVTLGQTNAAMFTTALEQASVSNEEPPVRPAPSITRELLGERWPLFDLGARGIPADPPRRPSRTALEGSSEHSPGGSSDLVRPAEQSAP